MRHHTRSGQLLHHEPPPGAALHRDIPATVGAVLTQPATQHISRGRTNLTPPDHSRVDVHVIERDLLSMHVETTYDRHWDLLTLPKTQ